MARKALNDDDDDLTEPLLVNAIPEKASAVGSSLMYSKIVMSLYGCFMAALSQAVLSVWMWDETILQRTTLAIVNFSLTWSFWTCIILFLGMTVVRWEDPQDEQDETTTGTKDHASEDRMFQVEAQYVVAALLTISAIWIMDSILLAVFVVLGMCFMVSKMEQGLLSSYSLVAGTLGLIFGSCSQFILSLCMWEDVGMSRPVIHHIFLFSIVWSLLTVCMTFVGCMSLRWIVENDRRAVLRMEAYYVAMTLIGICGAWVFLDLAAGLPEQIAPSIFMLLASLAAFGVILQCFPEDACLAEEEALLLTTTADEGVEKREDDIIMVV